MADSGGHADLGAAVRLGDGRVLVGTCSWTDKTLTNGAHWYPRRTMTPEERLRFYAARFPIVEVDSTYYRPLGEQQARVWGERTPKGFVFDIKAYSLFTGHPTKLTSLWTDLRGRVSEDAADKPNVYAHHLDPEALDEAWARFDSALRPLHDAGKLGAVLFQYPPWFGPRRDNRKELVALRERLRDYRVCVEFRSPRWLEDPRDRERTLDLLESAGLALVCVDAPETSGLSRLRAATTPELAVIRCHGRNDTTWKDTRGSAAERFRYDYAEDELAELAGGVARLAADAHETHLLMNNCYRDFAVRNGDRLRELLRSA